MDIDRRKIQDDLTTAFIYYQENLDNPMTSHLRSRHELETKYMSDVLFHNKVKHIVCGVMTIIERNIAEKEAE